MNPEQFKQILDRITYKPGTKIRLDREFNYGRCTEWTIRIQMMVQDALSPSPGLIPVAMKYMIDPEGFADERSVVDFVKGLLASMEMHELAEFFRYENQYWVDPHPNLPEGDAGRPKVHCLQQKETSYRPYGAPDTEIDQMLMRNR